MKKINSAIWTMTIGFVLFTLLCTIQSSIPFSYLVGLLLILDIGLVWMVLVILQNGEASDQDTDQHWQ